MFAASPGSRPEIWGYSGQRENTPLRWGCMAEKSMFPVEEACSISDEGWTAVDCCNQPQGRFLGGFLTWRSGLLSTRQWRTSLRQVSFAPSLHDPERLTHKRCVRGSDRTLRTQQQDQSWGRSLSTPQWIFRHLSIFLNLRRMLREIRGSEGLPGLPFQWLG